VSQRLWTVNGVGTHSEVYSEELKCWIKASRHVARPCTGMVEVSGSTEAGERVTITLREGDTCLVR